MPTRPPQQQQAKPRVSPHPPTRRPPERRRHTRRAAEALPGRIGFAQSLRVLDLSRCGARIATSEALGPGRRYHFQIAGLHLIAAVVRCALVTVESEDQGTRPVFEAGVVFEPPASTVQRQLGQILATLNRRAASAAAAG